MNEQYALHPIALLFPEMTIDEQADLDADVKRNGLVDDILLYEGKILDGRHRYKSCLSMGVAPRFEEITAQNDVEAWLIAKSKNLSRRHIASAEQRCAILLKAAEMIPEVKQQIDTIKSEATSAQKSGGRGHVAPRGRSAKRIGKLAGVSESTAKRVQRVKNEAPEEFDKLTKGKTTTAKVLKNLTASNKRVDLSSRKSETSHGPHQEQGTPALPDLVVQCKGTRSFFIQPEDGYSVEEIIKLLKTGEATVKDDLVELGKAEIAWLEMKEEKSNTQI